MNDELIIREHFSQIKNHIQEEYNISSISYKTWIMPLTLQSVVDHVVTISVHSDQSYMKNYVSKLYTEYFEKVISEMMNEPYSVVFVQGNEETVKAVRPDPSVSRDQRFEQAGLNPRYRFDTFVVGGNNRFAQSAALAVSETPGMAYNPLYIYGGAGLGKTHLLQSIGHYVLDADPSKKVLYVTSEQFTNDVIEAVRDGKAASMTNLRNKYRTVDLLLIDDIQFIIGKSATQEEFFHTFNELHRTGRQIVLSSDRPPKEIKELEERFRSRFEWGLIADISEPDYETRMAILLKNAEQSPHVIDKEILVYIATNIQSNIRELEGAYNKIIAYSRLNNVDITMEIAQEALKDIIYPEKNKVCTPRNVIDAVCDHYGVSYQDVIGVKRNAEIVLPRQIIMYIMYNYLNLTYNSIGKELGNRDHTTVMSGWNKIKNEISDREDVRRNVELIVKKLNL